MAARLTGRNSNPVGVLKTAIIWLTHVEDDQIFKAFERLEREARDKFPVYGIYSSGVTSAPSRHPRIRTLCNEDLRAAIPTRAHGLRPAGDIVSGFVDLLHFAAVDAVPDHDYYWLIEYDVDFSGNWLSFFNDFVDSRADVLGTTLFPKKMDVNWWHWRSFEAPYALSKRKCIRGFFPILRLSRKMIELYRRAVPAWAGHYEALYPTIASQSGLFVEDIGGDGPFTPFHRCHRYYWNTYGDGNLSPGCFRYRPPVSNCYYGERASNFSHVDVLWHPIKTDTHQSRQIRYLDETPLGM